MSTAPKWRLPSTSIGWRKRTATNCASPMMSMRGSRRMRWSRQASASLSCGASQASKSDAPETSGIPHVTIYAYASGTVVDRKVTQGQYVNAGDTLFTVADLSQVWIKADVYEEQLPQIHPGQQVDLTAESLPDRTLHGHVDFIEPAANQQTRTVPVMSTLPTRACVCLPGMFVNATFVSTRGTVVHRRSPLGCARYGNPQDRLSGQAQWRV